MIIYDREILVTILIYHYMKENASCGCGWAELGRSYTGYVADIYEASIAARKEE